MNVSGGGTQYYYLKIGSSNCLAEDWLAEKNPMDKPAVVIFFGDSRLENLKEKKLDENKAIYKKEKSIKQAMDFCNCQIGKSVFVVLAKGSLWLLKPKGEVREYVGNQIKDEHYERQIAHGEIKKISDFKMRQVPKVREVEIIRDFDVKEVPHILSSMNCNQSYTRKTFTPINRIGNKYALDYLKKNANKDKAEWEGLELNGENILQFLSPNQFETLIAKIFEAYDLFVPAYRGGNMQGIDLFVENKNKKTNEINYENENMVIRPLSALSFQVKADDIKKDKDRQALTKNCDYLVHFGEMDCKHKTLGRDWIKAAIKGVEESDRGKSLKEWLVNSLDWIKGKGNKSCVAVWLES